MDWPRIDLRCALVAGLAITMTAACSQNEYEPPPPPTVTVAHPTVNTVTDYLAYSGQARAVESVQVQARVKGFLQSMNYVPGSEVKKGDLLFVIDPKPFEVEVAARKADLSSREAEADLAQTSFDRSRQLYKQKATSEIEYLRFRAERDKANAAVLAAQAALADAELDLDYAYVKSPIDGRAGRNQVDLGNLVGADQTTLLTDVVQHSPLFVYFQISELDVLRIQRQLRATKAAALESGEDAVDGAADEAQPVPAEPMTVEAAEAEVEGEITEDVVTAVEPVDEASGGTRYGRGGVRHAPPVEVGVSGEPGYPYTGILDFSDSSIDPNTGTLELRGILKNEGDFDAVILPGSFVRVRVPVGEFDDALLVPDHALGADQGGRYLLVVGSDDLVEQRYVEPGANYDGMRRIVSGIIDTDRVVVNGLQRARPGARVSVRMEGEKAPAVPAADPAAQAE